MPLGVSPPSYSRSPFAAPDPDTAAPDIAANDSCRSESADVDVDGDGGESLHSSGTAPCSSSAASTEGSGGLGIGFGNGLGTTAEGRSKTTMAPVGSDDDDSHSASSSSDVEGSSSYRMNDGVNGDGRSGAAPASEIENDGEGTDSKFRTIQMGGLNVMVMAPPDPDSPVAAAPNTAATTSATTTATAAATATADDMENAPSSPLPPEPKEPKAGPPVVTPAKPAAAVASDYGPPSSSRRQSRAASLLRSSSSSNAHRRSKSKNSYNLTPARDGLPSHNRSLSTPLTASESGALVLVEKEESAKKAPGEYGPSVRASSVRLSSAPPLSSSSHHRHSRTRSYGGRGSGAEKSRRDSAVPDDIDVSSGLTPLRASYGHGLPLGGPRPGEPAPDPNAGALVPVGDGVGVDDSLALTTSSRTTCRVENESTSVYMSMTTSDRGGGGGGDLLTESLRSSLGGSLRKSSRSSSSSLEPRMGGAARHPRRPAEFGGSGNSSELTLTPSRPGGNYATVASAGAERVVEDGGKDVFLSLKNGGVGDGNEEEEDDVLQTPGSAVSALTASTPGWGSLRYRRPDHAHSPSSSSGHRKSAFENRLVLYEEDKQRQEEDGDEEELVGDYGVPLSRRQSSARKSSGRNSGSSKRRSTGASKKASTKKTTAKKSGGRRVDDGDDEEEGSFADKQHREQRGMVDLVRVGSGKGLGAAAPPTPPTLDGDNEGDEDEEMPRHGTLPAVPEALAPPDLDAKDSEEKEDDVEAKKASGKGRRGSLGGSSKKKSSATKMLLKAMSAPARSFRKKGSSSGHHRSSSSGGGAVPSSPLRKIQSSMSWGSSSATPSSPAPSPRSSTLPPTSSSSSTPSKELADAILREVREQEHDDLAAASPGEGSLTKDVLTEPVMAERAQRGGSQRRQEGGNAPQDRPARGDSALGDLASDSLEEAPYEDGDGGSDSDNESEGEYRGRRNSASNRFAAAASGGVETPPSTPTHPRHRKSQTTSPSDARSIASGKSTPSVRLSISEKGAVEAELGTELAIELYQPPAIERVPTDELETESEAEEDEEELLRKHKARRSHVGISRPSYRSAFDDGGRALEDAKKVKSRRKKRGGDSERALVVRDPNDRALAVVPSGSDNDSDDDSYDSEGSDGYLSESEERIGISRPSYDPAGGAEDEEEERPVSSSSSALAVSSSSRALVLHKSATKHKRASGASFTVRDEAKQASRLADVLASPLHGYMTGLSPQSLKNRQLSGVSRTVHRHTSEGRYDARDALTPSQGGRAKGRHWSGPDGADRNLLSRGYSVDSLARRGETVREWGGVRVYSLGAEEGHGQRMPMPPPALPAPHPSPSPYGGGGGLGASGGGFGGASPYASPFAPKGRSSSTPGGDQPWALTTGTAASGKNGRAGQDVGNNMRSAPPALMGTPAPKQFAEEIVDDSDDSDYEQDDNGSIPESVTAHHGVAPRSEPPQAMNTPSAVLMSMSYHTPSASSSLVKRNSPARASSASEANRPPPLDDSNYGALVPFAANSPSTTPTKPTASSPRPAVTFKIFVLLLNPSLKIFELIQVVYDPSTATVGDVLDLVPQNATEPLLGRQRHVGLVRPGKHASDSDYENAEMTDLDMLASGIPGNDDYGGNYASAKIQRGEILVAIPSGFDGRVIAGAAAPILRNKQVARLLGRADPLSPKNIEDDRREMERHAEEQEEEARAAQEEEEMRRSSSGRRQRSQRKEGSRRAVENGGGERRRERRKGGGATEPNGDSGLMAKLTAGEEI